MFCAPFQAQHEANYFCMKPKSKDEKKHYEVLITGWSTVLVVSAENEEKALEYACNECSFGDFQMEEAKIERVVNDDELDNARRDADCVAEDPDEEDDDDEE